MTDSRSYPGSEHAKVADWLEDQARIATTSLHCGDNSGTIQRTHAWARKLEAAALHLRAPAQTQSDPQELTADQVAYCRENAAATRARWREHAQASWQPIETAPKDKDLLLGWYRTYPEPAWEVAAGLAGSTKGGWLHGQATHWMPQPGPPLSSTDKAGAA